MKTGMMEYWNIAARDDLFSFENPLFQYSNIPYSTFSAFGIN